MAEIISSPLIYSQQEVKDRFQMHRFIHKLFVPCKTGTGDLTGVPAEELYHVFKIQYPMNVLNEAITSNMLLTGGFVDQENPEQSVLYAKINEIHFTELKKEAQLCLLPYVKEPMALRFRQLLMGIKVVNNTDGLTLKPDFTVRIFIHLFTLNRDNADSYMNSVLTKQRSLATDVYNYYRIICYIYKWPAVDKMVFNTMLNNLGYATTKGRVNGKAGMRYYRNLYIPQTIEDKILSVELNMCCMFNGNTHWTIMGILENFIEAQREELCNKNLERMGFDEQERKKIQEEKAKIDLRRTFETGEIPLGQATTKNEAKNDMGYNGGSEPKSQTAEIKTSQVKLEDTNSRTSGFKGTEDRAAAKDPSIEHTADFDEPLDLGESYRDRYAKLYTDAGSESEYPIGYESDDEGVGGDTVEGDGPSLEEIASALVVPYTMSVATGFTKDVMLSWLQKMSIPEPETILEHYDEIMEILVNT